MAFLDMLKRGLTSGGRMGITDPNPPGPAFPGGGNNATIGSYVNPHVPGGGQPYAGQSEGSKIADAKRFMMNLTTDEMGNPLSEEEKQRKLAEFWNKMNAGSGNDMPVGRQF